MRSEGQNFWAHFVQSMLKRLLLLVIHHHLW